MYTSLLDMERKLDWTMTRKKVEIQDALARNPTVRTIAGCLALTLMNHFYRISDNKNIEDFYEPYRVWTTMANRS